MSQYQFSLPLSKHDLAHDLAELVRHADEAVKNPDHDADRDLVHRLRYLVRNLLPLLGGGDANE
jgi:hypothetical protein